MVTSAAQRGVRAFKLTTVFTGFAQKLANQADQWVELLSHRNASRRFVRGPGAFICATEHELIDALISVTQSYLIVSVQPLKSGMANADGSSDALRRKLRRFRGF
jgi:hypothetical protein